MRREAKRCAHTLDKYTVVGTRTTVWLKPIASPACAGLCHNESIFPIVCKHVIFLVMGTAITLFVLDGCSSSSPRFSSEGKKSARKETGSNHGPRFASKEAEEEVKETDKKPDAHELKSISSGTRDFRKEKNESIKPIDQSKMMREISKYMGVPYVSWQCRDRWNGLLGLHDDGVQECHRKNASALQCGTIEAWKKD